MLNSSFLLAFHCRNVLHLLHCQRLFSSGFLLQLLLKSLCDSKDQWLDFVFYFEWEHCYSCFLAFISGTRGEKYLSTLKVLMLVWWEFSKDRTCVILLECPSVFMCLTPLEVVSYLLKSHSY